jgi:hypothetical protein
MTLHNIPTDSAGDFCCINHLKNYCLGNWIVMPLLRIENNYHLCWWFYPLNPSYDHCNQSLTWNPVCIVKIVRSICPFVRGILLLNLPWLAPLVSSIWISYFHWGRCFTVILKAQLGWLPSCGHGSAHRLLTIFRVGSYFLTLPPAAPRLKFSRYAFDAGDYCIVFAGDK